MSRFKLIEGFEAAGDFALLDTKDIERGDVKLNDILDEQKQDISKAKTDIKNNADEITDLKTKSADYAKKSEVYTKSEVYSKAETNTELAKHPLKTEVYTKSETDTELAKKVNTQSGYGLISDAEKAQIQTNKTAAESLREDLTATQSDVSSKASSESVSDLQTEMAVQTARMDQLVGAVPPGSADEIADARVMTDGSTANNLGAAIRTQCTRLKEHIDSVGDDVFKILENGTVTFDASLFVNGSATSINAHNDLTHRVCLDNKLYTPRKRDISINTGFWMYFYYDTGSGVQTTGWVTNFTIPADCWYILTIKRNTEDTSEIANVAEFVSQMSEKSVLKSEVESQKTEIMKVRESVSEITNAKDVLYTDVTWEKGGINDQTGNNDYEGSDVRSRTPEFFETSKLSMVTNRSAKLLQLMFYKSDGSYANKNVVVNSGQNYAFKVDDHPLVRFDSRNPISDIKVDFFFKNPILKEVEENKLETIKTRNIFTGWKQGYIDGETGSFFGASFKNGRSDLIPIVGSQTYSLNTEKNNGSVIKIHFYDSEKELISATSLGAYTKYRFIAPANSRYVAFTIFNSAATSFAETAISNTQLEVGLEITAHVNHEVTGLFEDNTEKGKNLFDTVFRMGFANTDTGIEYYTSPHNCITVNKIPVEGNTWYTLSCVHVHKGTTALYAFEYSNTGYIKRQAFGSVEKATFITDTNTTYIKIGVYCSNNTGYNDINPENMMLMKGSRQTSYVKNGELTERVNANKIYAKLIEDGTIDGFVVPDYYFENNYLPDKVAFIETLINNCASNGDVFGFITDMHWSINAKKSPALLNYISKNLNISKLICGGDHYDGYKADVPLILRKAFNGDIYTTPGNHEYMVHTTDDQLYYLFNMYNKDAVFGNTNRNYYYVDNKQQKIRYVFVNGWAEQLETTPDYGGSEAGFEAEQLDWLRNTALNVDAEWTIVVITHSVYTVDMTTRALSRSPYNAKTFENVLDDYNGNGTIACVIQGHAHSDRITHTEGGIPVVIVTSDKNTPYTSQGASDLDFDRPSGTTYEQAFDVVVLDKTNRKLTFVRIGAPALDGIDDSVGNQVEFREVIY